MDLTDNIINGILAENNRLTEMNDSLRALVFENGHQTKTAEAEAQRRLITATEALRNQVHELQYRLAERNRDIQDVHAEAHRRVASTAQDLVNEAHHLRIQLAMKHMEVQELRAELLDTKEKRDRLSWELERMIIARSRHWNP
ncbi:hypothetical protein FE257_009966 [Aspergillus nanangensis]|uniref:Uncharacterized protein n=1 Tax=Aspergillus nanangensis TaxID=2582783 RepID=A0AAD4CWH7_ASPNN|nr:hypothetical protein FE257_009966 [Aspergillus nanangensis]